MTIKIFDLCCANGHVFEGWFSSVEDFESQNDKKLIACPICSDTRIERRPSPSRIGRSSEKSTDKEPRLEALRERFEAAIDHRDFSEFTASTMVKKQERLYRSLVPPTKKNGGKRRFFRKRRHFRKFTPGEK